MSIAKSPTWQEPMKHNGFRDLALLKLLWPYVKPHQRWLWWSLALLIPTTLTQVTLPLIVKAALDGPVQQMNPSGLWGMAAGYVGVLAVHYVCKQRLMLFSQLGGQHIIYDLRTALYRHLQTLSPSFYHRTPVGKLVTRITNDIENLSEMFSSGAVSILLDLAVIVGVVIAMATQSLLLTAVTVVMLIVIMAMIEWLRRKVRSKSDDIRVNVAVMNGYLQENFSAMTLVQLSRREAKNAADFETLNRKNLKTNLKLVFYESSLSAVVEYLSSLTLVAVIGVSVVAITQGAMTFGLLIAFFLFVQMIFSPIEDLAEKYVIIQSGLSSVDKLMELLKESNSNGIQGFNNDLTHDLPHDLPGLLLNTYAVPELPQSSLRGKIEFKSVDFGYLTDRPVLRQLSWTAEPGQTIAIVGPTGAGKTTLIKLLLGFYAPTAGQIILDDCSRSQPELMALRNQMVSIQQEDSLFSRTVAENITLNPDEALSLEHRPLILEALAQVNINGLANDWIQNPEFVLEARGQNLSAGQRQLLLFARAIYHNPAILILDEATSAIDPYTEQGVQQVMQRLMVGRTSLVIAHRLSTIEEADRILVLQQGQLIEQGTHIDLMNQGGLYRRFHQTQRERSVLSKTILREAGSSEGLITTTA